MSDLKLTKDLKQMIDVDLRNRAEFKCTLELINEAEKQTFRSGDRHISALEKQLYGRRSTKKLKHEEREEHKRRVLKHIYDNHKDLLPKSCKSLTYDGFRRRVSEVHNGRRVAGSILHDPKTKAVLCCVNVEFGQNCFPKGKEDYHDGGNLQCTGHRLKFI